MHQVHSDLNNVPVFRDTNELKKKAKGLKKDYDRLHRLSTNQVGYLILCCWAGWPPIGSPNFFNRLCCNEVTQFKKKIYSENFFSPPYPPKTTFFFLSCDMPIFSFHIFKFNRPSLKKK
jgi:hypothetical protein